MLKKDTKNKVETKAKNKLDVSGYKIGKNLQTMICLYDFHFFTTRKKVRPIVSFSFSNYLFEDS